MADTIQQKGADMLDAPVSGGEGGAIAETLSIMVRGNEAIFNRCLPIFEAMGKNIVHLRNRFWSINETLQSNCRSSHKLGDE